MITSSGFNCEVGVKRFLASVGSPNIIIQCHSPDDNLNIYDPEDLKTYIIPQAFTEQNLREYCLQESEAKCLTQQLVDLYQTKRHHISEQNILLHNHRSENLRFTQVNLTVQVRLFVQNLFIYSFILKRWANDIICVKNIIVLL